MQIYWKMINELQELGEMLVIHDPSVLREYHRWCNDNNITYHGTFRKSEFLKCIIGPTLSEGT